jgi:hypothetical protein
VQVHHGLGEARRDRKPAAVARQQVGEEVGRGGHRRLRGQVYPFTDSLVVKFTFCAITTAIPL